MIAISLWQPWASAIAAGLKTIETRSWRAECVGSRIAIHAAKRATPDVRDFWLHRAKQQGPAALEGFAGIGIRDWCDMPLGAIVATADLVSVETTAKLVESGKVRAESGEFFWGNFAPVDDQSGRPRYGWQLANVTPLKVPAPCKGWQNFFTWDPATNATVGMPPASRGRVTPNNPNHQRAENGE